MKYCFLKVKRFNKKNLLKNILNIFKTLIFIKMDPFNYLIMDYYTFAIRRFLLSKLRMFSDIITKICEILNIINYVNHSIIIIIT